MKRAGKDFSRKITPLFDTMMVLASEEVGEDSNHPTDSNQIPIHEESVPTPSNDPLHSGEDSMQLNDLMVLCTNLQNQVLDLEKAKSDQAIEIASLKKRVDKLEKRRKFRTTRLKRLKKDEDLMFDTRVLDDDEMFVDTTIGEKDEQSTKIDDSTVGEAVTTASVEDSAALTIPTTHVSKPTVSVTQPLIKGKGKGIMQEPEKPLTKKDQVALDEDLARNIQAQLDAEIIEEDTLKRQKQEEDNIALIKSWEIHKL
ncbi:hypothetical protein Tco_0863424 [Tanacetum coccineum]